MNEECRRCRVRGYLSSGNWKAFCCDYAWITGKCRSALPKREDGLCPGYEPGRRIHADVKRHDVPLRRTPPRPAMKYDADKMMELYRLGLSDGAIGRIIGCDKSTVQGWRTRNALTPNYRPTKGGKENGRAEAE